jgi:uncharacterized protein YajQ (UPF0234 family)
MASFDVVSVTDIQEVDNAVNGVAREIAQRYDFKGTDTSISRVDNEITIDADDDYKITAVQDMLKVYFTRREIDPKSLDFQKVEAISGNRLKQVIKVKQGIDQDTAKKIIKEIKTTKIKVQASIRGEELRINGKKRDDLQQVIKFIKGLNIDLPLQFINFRD